MIFENQLRAPPRPRAPRTIALAGLAAAALLLLVDALPLRELPRPWLNSLHIAVKMLGSAIALAISLLTWNTRRAQPLGFALAGFAFFAVAVLGAAQLIMLPGMPGLAQGREATTAAVLQLGCEAAAWAGLLAAALGPGEPGSARTLRAGVAVTAAAVAASISAALAAPQLWPGAALASGGGPVLAITALAVVLLLLWSRARRARDSFVLLAGAAVLGTVGVAGVAPVPADPFASGLVDDSCQALAGLLVYLALFRAGVLAPQQRLLATGRAVDEDRRRYQQLFDSSPDGLLLIDRAGRIDQANGAAAAMFGWPLAELIGQRAEVLVPEALRGAHRQLRERFHARPQSREMGRGGSLAAARRDGSVFPVEVALVPQTFGGGRTTMCIVRDVTERRKLEKSLLRQALQDTLTELPNRRHFGQSMAKALAHAERHGGSLALMFIDLDQFKQINDSLGHSHGDELLRQAARRLRDTVRADDLLARMGGDEFALLLTGAQAHEAAAVAAKVLGVLEPDFHHAGQTMTIGASIGIALYPADGRSAEELLSHADIAMYRAKQRGRHGWCFFEARMNDGALDRLALQRDLAHAVERDELELVFQPRVRAADGQPSGFEALLRWRHPQRGLVMPDTFITLAEETGLIVPIGEWVLRQSCAQASRWRAAGARPFTMAVNVSTHQLRDAGFAACVRQVLVDTGWPARQLELEITETALMEEPREAAALLQGITALGVRIAVDDFGTGYSSLAYLKTFPLHRLKVDRSFVQGLQTQGGDRVIAAAIIALAHALGLQVTAEGVETAEQRDVLLQQDCDELQGYLFSAPLPAAGCDAWLPRTGSTTRTPGAAPAMDALHARQ